MMQRELPPEEEIQALAALFRTFGDATRLRIMAALMGGPLCVQDVADSLGMSQSAISHQLAVLKGQHLVGARREGKSMFYELADDHVSTIFAQGLSHVEE